MENKKRNRKHHNWNEQKNLNKNEKNTNVKPLVESQKFKFVSYENVENQQKKEKAIQDLKAREIKCPMCGELIQDVASAISDKASGNPVHFECVMKTLSESEKVGQNEKICYIGKGRFGILYFENPRDQRRFTIKKIIEWEERDKKIEWRDEMSGLYSQIE